MQPPQQPGQNNPSEISASTALNALKKSEEQYSMLFEAAPIPMWIFDLETRKFVKVNPAAIQHYGYSEAEFLEMSVYDIRPPDGYGRLDLSLGEVLQAGRFIKHQLPFRHRKKDGTIILVEISANRVVHNGRDSVLVVAHDVSEKVEALDLAVRAKRAVENERENFRRLFRQTPEMVCILKGRDHVFEFVNEAHVKALGFDATGKTVQEAQPESVEIYGILDEVYRTGVTAQLHEYPVTLTNRVRYFNLTYSARRDVGGEINGVMVLGVEVTSQVQARLELEQAKENAERANKLKSAFLANMSHEIRTPLGAILGFTDLMKEPSLDENDRAAYLNIISRNGEQLTTVINDILDLSKIEAGHMTIETIKTSPAKVLEEAISLLDIRAKEKCLALKVACSPDLPTQIGTDPVRLKQILINIVGNAIKFTEAGSVTVEAWYEKRGEGAGYLVFEISDTGIGIPDDQKERLFKPFSQADESMTRKFGGTGLGLALSKRLAEALGGSVALIRSEPGQGAVFRFEIKDRLDFAEDDLAIQPAAETAEKSCDLSKASVLVVEDSPDNQNLVGRILTRRGARVTNANNGLEGLEKALAGNFDLVLMDVQMPVMDGYTATVKLRALGFSKPIIALTAHAMSEVRQRCLEHGCTDYLPKPVNGQDLLRMVARFTR